MGCPADVFELKLILLILLFMLNSNASLESFLIFWQFINLAIFLANILRGLFDQHLAQYLASHLDEVLTLSTLRKTTYWLIVDVVNLAQPDKL